MGDQEDEGNVSLVSQGPDNDERRSLKKILRVYLFFQIHPIIIIYFSPAKRRNSNTTFVRWREDSPYDKNCATAFCVMEIWLYWSPVIYSWREYQRYSTQIFVPNNWYFYIHFWKFLLWYKIIATTTPDLMKIFIFCIFRYQRKETNLMFWLKYQRWANW